MVEVARDLTADVHNFMRNINLTVSDYISQQYMVRGSPSYKVLKVSRVVLISHLPVVNYELLVVRGTGSFY